MDGLILDSKQKQTRGTLGISHSGDTGRPKDDFYRTPAAATVALYERESLEGGVWEPACGDGAISEVFREKGLPVISSDIHDHGYGMEGADFLKQKRLLAPNIVTNPPFNLAPKFAQHALDLGADKVCLFLRLSFLEGQRRYESRLWRKLHRVWVFSQRMTLWRDGHARVGEDKGGMIAFAWFVWENSEHEQGTQLGHIPPLKSAL